MQSTLQQLAASRERLTEWAERMDQEKQDFSRREAALEKKLYAIAQFPEENPNPVLRVSFDKELVYANNASEPILEEWGSQEIPASFFDLIRPSIPAC